MDPYNGKDQAPKLLRPESIEWIESMRVKYGIPGVGIAAVSFSGAGDQARDVEPQVHIETFGKRNSHGDPFDEETIFAIGSNSKLFASLTCGMIIHKGIALPDGKQLTWSTKVKDVLGDLWQLSDEYATEHADLDDLAGMRLGMATHAFAKMSLDPPEDPADQLRRLRLLPWGGGQFRRQFGYDSNNYVALSHLAPVLTGKPYHSFLDDEIFRPLKMASATGDSNIVRASGNAADGFLRKGGDPSESGTGRLGSPQSVGWWTQDDGFWCLAAGGVSMNIRDASRFVAELLEPKVLASKVVAERGASLTAVSGQQIPSIDPDVPSVYGRGQLITAYRGQGLIWHTGNLPGQVSTMACIPRSKVGIFIAVNDGSIGSGLMSAIRNRMLDDLLGLEASEDYEAKFLARLLQPIPPSVDPNGPSKVSRSSKESPSLSIRGHYSHPAYFEMDLRPFDPSTPQAEAMIDIARKQGLWHGFDESCLVAKVSKFWLSHLVFRPLATNSNETLLCDWNAFQVYSIRDSEAFVSTVRVRGQAVFTKTGVGIFGFADAIMVPFQSLDSAIVHDPAAVEKHADVWFKRHD